MTADEGSLTTGISWLSNNSSIDKVQPNSSIDEVQPNSASTSVEGVFIVLSLSHSLIDIYNLYLIMYVR